MENEIKFDENTRGLIKAFSNYRHRFGTRPYVQAALLQVAIGLERLILTAYNAPVAQWSRATDSKTVVTERLPSWVRPPPGALFMEEPILKDPPKEYPKEHPDIELEDGGRLTWCEICESYWQCGCDNA